MGQGGLRNFFVNTTTAENLLSIMYCRFASALNTSLTNCPEEHSRPIAVIAPFSGRD